MQKTRGGGIDTTMNNCPPAPGRQGAAGKYDEHPNLGPAGVSGGMPLKFTDESISTPEIQPTDNPGMIIPARKRSS